MGALGRLFSVRPAVDDHVLRVIGETRLFENLSLVDIERLSEQMEAKKFASGEIVFRQGDDADGLYIIDVGTVEVLISSGASEKRLAKFFDRDFFGEMALIDDFGRRTATVRAIGEVECLHLSKENFDRLLASSHATAAKILYHLCRVLARRLGKTSRQAAGLE